MWQKISLGGLVLIVIVAGQSLRQQTMVTGKSPVITAQVFNQKQLTPGTPQEPSLIYFWATWCGTCKAIQGTVQTILQEHPGITVAMKSGDKKLISQYLKSQSLDWPFVVDEMGQISSEFGVPGVPSIFILDRTSKIRFTAVGYSSYWGLKLRLWLAGFE